MDMFRNLFKRENKRIFLDYASATPELLEVKREMEKFESNLFYNPSAIYKEALEVKREMENYRGKVAEIVGAGQKEIIFTASGTDSIKLAILGVFEEASKHIKIPHIIISAIEHQAVMKAAEEVERRGGEVTVCEVDEEGKISLEVFKKCLKKNTVLISIGLANSEIGTIQPVAKIGRLIREYRKKRNSQYPLLHTDASAATNYLPINIEQLQCDLLTIDGGKIYGPKGIGILARRRGVSIHKLYQGTLPTQLVAGFAKALEIAERDRERESARLEVLRQILINSIVKTLPQASINGSSEEHLPNIVSVSLPNILSEFLTLKLDQENVLVSVGTACSLDERESGSPVMRAINKDELKESTIRISSGRFTSKKDLHRAIEIFCRVAQNMVKSGSNKNLNATIQSLHNQGERSN